METDESNLCYCIIVKYTKARVREVFLLFGYLYRQEQLPLFLQGLVENNLHEVFVRFCCGLCIKLINSRVLGFLQSQMFFCDYVPSHLYSNTTEVHLSFIFQL